MKIDDSRLELLVSTFVDEEDCIDLYPANAKNKLESKTWYITSNGYSELGPVKDGDYSYTQDLTRETLLKRIEGIELKGSIFLGYQSGESTYRDYEDWDDYAKAMGVSKLVAVSAKVPETIAKRFEFFANQTSNKSTKLRELIVEYVADQWKEQADDLIFRAEI